MQDGGGGGAVAQFFVLGCFVEAQWTPIRRHACVTMGAEDTFHSLDVPPPVTARSTCICMILNNYIYVNLLENWVLL